MKEHEDRQRTQAAHMLVLFSYTILAMALIGESLLMDWEIWALPLIAASVAACWILHFNQILSDRQRLWTYTLLMMGTFFFYGIHPTSTYDMGLLMMIVILIDTTAREIALINVCLATYYITLAYDLVQIIANGAEWDSLTISRTVLHICMMFMAGWLARVIIRRWAALFRDAEAQIEELNQSTARMNAFLANLSHELRTPVNAILGNAGMLLDGEADKGRAAQLQQIMAAGRRMESQTADILDYSELEMGTLVVNLEPYTLSSVLHDIVTVMRPMIPPTLELVIDVDPSIPQEMISEPPKLRRILFHLIGNSLKYTPSGGVYVRLSATPQDYGVNLCIEVRDTGVGMTPQEQEHLFRHFYQGQSGREVHAGGLGLGLSIVSGFTRILGGFMTVESAPGAGTTVRVSLPQQVTDDALCMSVTHPGRVNLGGYLNFNKFPDPNVREYYNVMTRNLVQGLKTPMHWVDNLDDLRRLTERMNLTHLFVGEAEYAADPAAIEALAAKCTVVIVARDGFKLPKNSRAQVMLKPFYCFPVISVLNAEPGQRPVEPGLMRCPNVRALVVDDEPMNLSVATGILRRYGMEVMTAISGKQAIELCRDHAYDVIFMDHMMPEMDGIETMKRLRREPRLRDCPIIALTANALSSARERFTAEGFDGFVSKPIELSDLERALRHVLPRSAIQDEDEAPKPATPAPAEHSPATDAALSAGGIDVRAGLHYSQDDWDFYQSLLRQFASESDGKRAELQRFADAGDCKNYAIRVHALKSTARMIGADALSEAARAQEAAAKDARLDVVRARHDALITQYAAAAQAVRDALGDAAPQSDEDDEILEFMP